MSWGRGGGGGVEGWGGGRDKKGNWASWPCETAKGHLRTIISKCMHTFRNSSDI